MSSSSSAKGSAAVAAGHAYLAKDQSALDALGVGLQLADLDAMNSSERCGHILDLVLGAPGTIDEEVVRRAALEALKDLMTNPDQSVDDSVSAFMAAYVYQSALVELTSHKASKRLSPDQVLRHEKSLRAYIKKTIKFSGIVDGPRLKIGDLLKKASRLRDKALNLLRGIGE